MIEHNTITTKRKPKITINEDLFYEKLGHKIFLARRRMRLTQTELGTLVGVSFQQIQKYECGYTRIPLIKLHLILKVFDISYDSFVGG